VTTGRALKRITHGRPVASIPIDGVARAHAVSHRARAETAEHAHEQASLTLILAGGFEERSLGAGRVYAPMSVLFKPPGMPHASCTGAGATRTITLAIDPAALDPVLLALQRSVELAAGDAARALLRIASALGASANVAAGRALADPIDTERALADALAAIAAHVRALLDASPEHAADDDARRSGARRRRLAPALDALAEAQAPVRAAAAGVDMHPVAFARAVRTNFACSPTEHRRRGQIDRAGAALAHTRDSLAAIAFDAGFADQPHFTRAFKRETGLTPGAYRALLRRCFPDP